MLLQYVSWQECSSFHRDHHRDLYGKNYTLGYEEKNYTLGHDKEIIRIMADSVVLSIDIIMISMERTTRSAMIHIISIY